MRFNLAETFRASMIGVRRIEAGKFSLRKCEPPVREGPHNPLLQQGRRVDALICRIRGTVQPPLRWTSRWPGHPAPAATSRIRLSGNRVAGIVSPRIMQERKVALSPRSVFSKPTMDATTVASASASSFALGSGWFLSMASKSSLGVSCFADFNQRIYSWCRSRSDLPAL